MRVRRPIVGRTSYLLRATLSVEFASSSHLADIFLQYVCSQATLSCASVIIIIASAQQCVNVKMIQIEISQLCANGNLTLIMKGGVAGK